MVLDAVVTLGGLLVPPAFDFIKKKFIKSSNDTPEKTMGSLATTKPEVLPDYVKALSVYQESQTKFFNRDVIGQPSPWVVDLRAAIRPVCVVVGLLLLVGTVFFDLPFDNPGVKLFFEGIISSWFGHRIVAR